MMGKWGLFLGGGIGMVCFGERWDEFKMKRIWRGDMIV